MPTLVLHDMYCSYAGVRVDSVAVGARLAFALAVTKYARSTSHGEAAIRAAASLVSVLATSALLAGNVSIRIERCRSRTPSRAPAACSESPDPSRARLAFVAALVDRS